MTTQPAQPNLPLLHNRYRIFSRLGDNRLAQVFRASDERLGRPVLVHILRPDLQENEALRRRFTEEAQGLAKRAHPALLDVFDQGDVAGRPYMVTEEVDGRPLRAALPLALPDALRMLRQIVGAVAITITTQTPTPPIASGAILVTPDNRPILAEPWWLSQQELRDELAYYRAPERVRGEPPSERSTVYALGLLGYEMMLGQRPWGDQSPQAAQQKHVSDEVPPLYNEMVSFMPSLAAALQLAAARDPFQRTLDVQSLARDLAAVDAAAEAPTKPLVRPMPAIRDTMREARRTITQRRRPTEDLPPPSSAPSAQAAAPVMQQPRPVMPPPQPPPQQLSRDDLRKEVRREVRREARRRGCLSFIRRRVVGLILLVVLAGGCYWGFTFGRDWFESGAAKTWACGWLPEFACAYLPGDAKPQPINYVVLVENTNVCSAPSISAPILESLPKDTRVTAPDPNDVHAADGNTWIRIETTYNNRRLDGWVALSLLQEEGSP